MQRPDHRRQAPAPEGTGITFPLGWSLRAASFSWLEETGDPRSAEAIFVWRAERAPDVGLRSRVPTFTLPCREFASGDWRGHGLEVAVGGDFSVRIALLEKSDATRPFVLATGDAIEAMRGLTDRGTRIKQLSLSVSMHDLPPETAHAKFAAALGLAEPEVGVADQRYRKKKRSLVGSEHDGFLDVVFELATAAQDQDQTHSLELTSQAQITSPSASSSFEDWSVVLGASLTTISSIAV